MRNYKLGIITAMALVAALPERKLKLGEQYAYEQALDGMRMPYGFWLHKALADHDNRLQPPSDDNKIEALAEKSKSEDLLAVSAVNQTVDSQEQHQEPTMDFGYAVKMMKNGKRVSRIGWNGKGMFLYYVPENKYPASRNEHGTMIGVFENDMVPYGAYIAMKTAQNNVVPWLASQTDVLAEDWVIV